MQTFLVGSILPVQPERRARLWIAVLGIIIFAGLYVFMNVGRWLVVEDPLQTSSAIAVLSGRMPSRALEAARVYKRGYAKEVWLTRSIEPEAAMEKLSVPFVGEDSYNKQILMHEGVPENAIRVLNPPTADTADEMKTIGEAVRKLNPHIVIIVTSKVHTRRVRELWDQLSSQNGAAVIHGVSDDSFDPSHWWRNTRDALDVVREVLGLANAWAGFPLHPAT